MGKGIHTTIQGIRFYRAERHNRVFTCFTNRKFKVQLAKAKHIKTAVKSFKTAVKLSSTTVLKAVKNVVDDVFKSCFDAF